MRVLDNLLHALLKRFDSTFYLKYPLRFSFISLRLRGDRMTRVKEITPRKRAQMVILEKQKMSHRRIAETLGISKGAVTYGLRTTPLCTGCTPLCTRWLGQEN